MPDEQPQPDMECKESDGCPTEKVVLQRYWREHQATKREVAGLTEHGHPTAVSLMKCAKAMKDYNDRLHEAFGWENKNRPISDFVPFAKECLQAAEVAYVD
jgi:hypothetical protein